MDAIADLRSFNPVDDLPKSLDDLFRDHTPIETYNVSGRLIDVKREDLYCQSIIAPLAKMRGVNIVMQQLKQQGFDTVGVFDFKVSKAGVGIAAMAKILGMKCIECYQHYKVYETEGLPEQQRQCQAWGAELYPIKASRININYAIAKRHLKNIGGYMFAKGIILQETMDSVANEVDYDINQLSTYDHIVINVGSGTILVGLLKGLLQNDLSPNIYGISCTDSVGHCKGLYDYLKSLPEHDLRKLNLKLFPAKQTYYSECLVECPFPSHPNYDRKAWQWLLDNLHTLDGKILFWNIGA